MTAKAISPAKIPAFDSGNRRIARVPQVAFMHLPKTGGTSALAALERYLPPEAIYTIAFGIPEDPNNLDLDMLRNKSLLYGHFSARWVGLFDRTTPIATCLRDPTATTRSFYKYFLAYKPENLSGRQLEMRKSAEGGFKNYLRFIQHERSSQYYVHYLDPLYGAHTNTALTGISLEKSVARALHFLDRCDIVGVSEKLNSFICQILAALEIQAHDIEVAVKNVSADLATELPGQFLSIQHTAEDVDDDETQNLLQEINRPLQQIYRHACSLAGFADSATRKTPS